MSKEKVTYVKGSVYNAIYENDPKLAAEMIAKADLVREIMAVKERRELTQTQLANLIGMKQPDVSRLLKGDFKDISLSRIMNCLTLLDRDVKIVVTPHPVRGEQGIVSASII